MAIFNPILIFQKQHVNFHSQRIQSIAKLNCKCPRCVFPKSSLTPLQTL